MCGPRLYAILIGPKVHTIKTVFSISRFVVYPELYFEWTQELYNAWSDDGFTYYPQVSCFEIPIHQESLKQWQRLFPNVPPESFQIITAEQISRFNLLSRKVIDLRDLNTHYITKRVFSRRKTRTKTPSETKVCRIEQTLNEVTEILHEIDELDRRSITFEDLDLAVAYLNSKGNGQWITRVNKLVDSFRAIRENKFRDTGISTERVDDEDT